MGPYCAASVVDNPFEQPPAGITLLNWYATDTITKKNEKKRVVVHMGVINVPFSQIII